MGLSKDDILEILKLLDASHYAEHHLQAEDLKLVVSKHGGTSRISDLKVASGGIDEPLSSGNSIPAVEESDRGDVKCDFSNRQLELKETASAEKALLAIRAPVLGTFYRAGKPGATPFVEVGSYVTENDTVCIVEVMKLFNTIKAGVRGRITEICVKDAEMVEYNQILFYVRPEDESEEGTTA